MLNVQTYKPWGEVRTGDIPQTTRDFTGQRRDGTGLLHYNARYYDAGLGLFLSPDTIVPGTASGAGGAAATVGPDQQAGLAALTVGFQEPAFGARLGEEHWALLAEGFFGRETPPSAGPANPQALNRYAYVLNNPVRYTDPTGNSACASLPNHPVKILCVAGEAARNGGIAASVAVASGFFAIMIWYAVTTGWRATIDVDKQGKHIPGHRNFIPGRSELTHPDPQALINKGMGTGVRYGHKEIVDFGESIGYWVDPATGEKHETTRGTIHYDSKGGAHIVPSRPTPVSNEELSDDE